MTIPISGRSRIQPTARPGRRNVRVHIIGDGWKADYPMNNRGVAQTNRLAHALAFEEAVADGCEIHITPRTAGTKVPSTEEVVTAITSGTARIEAVIAEIEI